MWRRAVEEKAWELDVLRKEDRADMLALICAEYGDVDLAREAYYDWLIGQMPTEVVQFAAREKATGKVVSASTLLGVRASWRGEPILAILGVNLVVDPRYRRQGVYRALATQIRDDIQDAGYRFMSAFPNQKSMPQMVKSDMYHMVSRVPLVIRPLNAQALPAGYVGNALLRWGVNFGWAIASRTLWRERFPSQNKPGLCLVAEGKELDEAYDRFWERVKLKYDLMVVRDRAFLQWRFCDIPTRDYQILSARRDGELVGYMVLRQTEVRGIQAGVIADFLVVPEGDGEEAGFRLLHEALHRFRGAKLAVAGGLALPHTQEYGIMRRAGFVDTPQRLAPQPFYLFVRMYADEPPLDVVTRPESWYVSIADHDAV